MCSRTDVFEMGTHRTRKVNDLLTSTCISIPGDLLENQLVFKMLPSRDYLFNRHVAVHVAGKGYSCSPIHGIAVFVQPTCVDHANCPSLHPCISLGGNNVDDLTVCKFRCQLKASWDYALVDLAAYGARARVTVDCRVCEIWFSNIYN